VARDATALPAPLERGGAGGVGVDGGGAKHKVPTHGGPDATPPIALKVRVKVGGWRDKSGARLTARLWCPASWKAALRRAELGWGATTTTTTDSDSPEILAPLDFSSEDGATMEAVANEILRFDLAPKREAVDAKIAVPPPPPRAGAVVNTKDRLSSQQAKDRSKKVGETIERLKPAAANGDVAKSPDRPGTTETTTTKKTKKRRPSTKDVDAPSSGAATVGTKSRPGGRRVQKFVPHVPRYGRSRFHPAVLAPSSSANAGRGPKRTHTASLGAETTKDGTSQDPYEREGARMLRHLYERTLHPALSPSERRSSLADEVSSALSRLESVRRSSCVPKMHAIHEQLNDLQSIYLDDLEIVPDNCNTIGMWNWMEKNNYFDVIEGEEDVCDGLEGIWQPEMARVDHDEEDSRGGIGHGDWGGFSKVPDETKVVKEEDGVEISSQEEDNATSPLVDRLLSLLVEEDEGSGDDDNEDDDDDDLLCNLPPFSPEEFIHGPKSDSGKASIAVDDTPDDAMLAVAALSLDQRTMIQLRKAGLFDASTPFNSAPQRPSAMMDEDDEPISAILAKMKSHLCSLNVQTNAGMATLQGRALAHIVSPTTRRRKRELEEDEIVLAMYERLQKVQRERKDEEEKQRQQQIIRTSGRVKTGSNKFDGEQWLPW